MTNIVKKFPERISTEDQGMETLCREMIKAVGEDENREGLQQTPRRFAKAFRELTSGYQQSVEQIINGAIFEEKYSEMVVVKDIEFFSLCEHHLLPFFGRAHIAYVPNGKIIGLSKIPRIVKMFAKRLQVQERLTEQVTETIKEVLNPLGVACVIEADHLCMMMRGVEVQSSAMVTSSMRGCFMKNPATRAEFMNIIHSPKKSHFSA